MEGCGMDLSWNTAAVLPHLVLWAGVSGVVCTHLGVRRRNSNTSRRTMALVLRSEPLGKGFSTRHVREERWVSGWP